MALDDPLPMSDISDGPRRDATMKLMYGIDDTALAGYRSVFDVPDLDPTTFLSLTAGATTLNGAFGALMRTKKVKSPRESLCKIYLAGRCAIELSNGSEIEEMSQKAVSKFLQSRGLAADVSSFVETAGLLVYDIKSIQDITVHSEVMFRSMSSVILPITARDLFIAVYNIDVAQGKKPEIMTKTPEVLRMDGETRHEIQECRRELEIPLAKKIDLPSLFPGFPYTEGEKKEHRLLTWLRAVRKEIVWHHDTKIDGSPVLRRVDIWAEIGDGAGGFLLCIECDEHQHKRYTRETKDRMMEDVFNSAGGKNVYLIMFNPDDYVVGGRKIKGEGQAEWDQRFIRLLSEIEFVINHPPTKRCNVVHLFYDS
jgi:hypothetical protein